MLLAEAAWQSIRAAATGGTATTVASTATATIEKGSAIDRHARRTVAVTDVAGRRLMGTFSAGTSPAPRFRKGSVQAGLAAFDRHQLAGGVGLIKQGAGRLTQGHRDQSERGEREGNRHHTADADADLRAAQHDMQRGGREARGDEQPAEQADKAGEKTADAVVVAGRWQLMAPRLARRAVPYDRWRRWFAASR